MAKKRIPRYKLFGGGRHRFSRTLSSTEFLKFRDKNGRLTKFDARKKLVAEIYNKNGEKTGRVLNKISKGKPVPQKFDSRKMKARLLNIKAERVGINRTAELKNKYIKLDARFTIVDNILAKADDMLSDIVKFSKRGNAGIVVVEFKSNDKYITIQTVEKSSNKEIIALNLARLIIHRLYRNEERMSGIKKSPMKNRAKYVRSKEIKFSWFETKRIKTI